MADFLTEADVAEELKITEKQAAEWRLRYGWPHLKMGRQVRYTAADLRAIAAQHHVDGQRITALPGQTALSAARSR